jgi:transcription initiation factor TFIIIB Brf1 subunit/transcription initiation factor TFIIB
MARKRCPYCKAVNTLVVNEDAMWVCANCATVIKPLYTRPVKAVKRLTLPRDA